MRCANYLVFLLCFLVAALVLRPVLLSCCTAGVLAYLLNPLVNKLESVGLPRTISSFVVILSSVSTFTALIVFLTPIVYSQILEVVKLIIDKLPFADVQNIKNILQTYDALRQDTTNTVNTASLLTQNWLSMEGVEFVKLFGGLYKNFSTLVAKAVSSGVVLGSAMIKVLVTILLSFYILSNWPFIVRNVKLLIPRQYVESFSRFTLKVDSIISAYIRGQTVVCIILSCYYCTCFVILGLRYSLVLGFASGLMTFVPYLGPILCTVLSMSIIVLQGLGWNSLMAVALIFVIGHIVESNIITPTLIGKKLDIDPGWMIVGMLVFSAHAGILGALLSVPVTAMVGVMVQLAVERYRYSDFYLGK